MHVRTTAPNRRPLRRYRNGAPTHRPLRVELPTPPGVVDSESSRRRDGPAIRLAGALRLGIAIRDAREAVGVTQTESAARMHVAQPAVSRIETGQTNVTIEMLARIATALGAPLSVRIGQEEAPLTR